MKKYSKKTRKTFVELLKHAKKNLCDGTDPNLNKSEYICFALPFTYTANELKIEIHNRLAPHNNVWSWLHKKVGIPQRYLNQRNVQAHRLAWINKLIEEFSQ